MISSRNVYRTWRIVYKVSQSFFVILRLLKIDESVSYTILLPPGFRAPSITSYFVLFSCRANVFRKLHSIPAFGFENAAP